MSDSRPNVLLALTPIAERAIEQQLFGENPPVIPVASVGEADELEAAAQDQTAIAVLISPQLSGLSPGHCERVRASGLRLVGVALDQHDEQALQAFAPDAITTPDEGSSELLAKINGAAEHRTLPTSPRPAKRSAAARHAGDGTALAVVGARGACGASECAASLALLAVGRWPTVLVELDALGGSLAVRLGSDPHEGSVLGLIRAAEAGEEIVPELLERWLTTAPGWPPVLLGPARGDAALIELAAPGAIATALNALRSTFPLSVWDVGSLLTAGGEVVTAARVHREALVAADAVLLVLGARDLHLQAGLVQLDLLLGDLEIPGERLRVLINGVGGPGAAQEKAITQALAPKLAERGLTADAWLGWDARALRRTVRTGIPLAGVRPRGAYARALGHLLDELFLPGSTRTRQRKLKLSVPAMTRPRVANDPTDEEVALPWQS